MYVSSAEQGRSERVRALAEQLYRERYDYLLRIAKRNAANHADAEEAVGDSLASFIRAYNPDGGAPPLAWVLLTLKRRCWASYRAQHLDRRLGQEAAPDSAEPGLSIEDIASEAAGVEETIEWAEWIVDARERLAALKPAERRALVLIAAGYSYKEIGSICNWSYTKTNRSAAEGRAALRATMAAQLP